MKYLIILAIGIYVFYKISSFFFRAGAASQELKNFKTRQQKNDFSSPKSKKGKISGGEYIDYEEVK